MSRMRTLWMPAAAALLLLACGAALIAQLPQPNVSGVVRLDDGTPAGGAWVRIKTTDNIVYADPTGHFAIAAPVDGKTIMLTAWYPEYKVGWAEVVAPASSVSITLRPYDKRDNPAYAWNTSYADPANPSLGCGHCMTPSFGEWKMTAHASAAVNPRFFSMYNGTNTQGSQAAAPGFKQDFPGAAGNCATCHAPGAAADAPFTTDMNEVKGVNREGVFCEFCHKVGAIYADSATGRPYNNAPGVMSMRLFRPFGDDQIFFGSLDDVSRRVSYLPVERQSLFCAPCHQFSFWGTPIYESFREWQESPYPAQGIECQTCHMPAGTSATMVPPSLGGLSRNPQRMASHLDLGKKDLAFMQATMEMEVRARTLADGVEVEVALTNKLGGHHVPTDYPGRHLLLTVAALDAAGQPLGLQEGPVIPEWGGDLSGLAGVGYAKLLRDVETGEAPVVNYWKRTRIVSDNRIPALGTATSRYRFALPSGAAPARIRARLVHRRLFQPLALLKGWDNLEVVMIERSVEAAPPSNSGAYQNP